VRLFLETRYAVPDSRLAALAMRNGRGENAEAMKDSFL
jgi:hypothetical protein